jgi:hypothetical protein
VTHLQVGHFSTGLDTAPDETCGHGTWTLTYTIKSKAHPAVRHTRHFTFAVPALANAGQ